MVDAKTASTAYSIYAVNETAVTGLGLAASYAIPWIMFFTSAVFPQGSSDTIDIRALWLIHLVTTSGSIALVGALLKHGAAGRLLSSRSMILLTLVLALSQVGLALVSRFAPDAFAAQVILVVLFSFPYGYHFFVLANGISHANLRTISLVAPLALANAALIAILVSLLPAPAALVLYAGALNVVIYIKNNQPFSPGPESAPLIDVLKRDQTNTVLSHMNRPLGIYLLIVLAGATTAVVLTRDFLGPYEGPTSFVFLILLGFAAVYFMFLLIRRREASMLKTIAAICIFTSLGHTLALPPFKYTALDLQSEILLLFIPPLTFDDEVR